MLFFLQKPPTNTQNVYMKYISYLKILNIAVHNYYTECCFLCQIVIFQMFLLIHFSLKKDKIEEISARIKENDKLHFAFNQPL